MFSLASGLYQAYFAAPELNVLVVGESGTGKTTLLERIKVTQFSKASSGGAGARKNSVIVERPERVPVQAFGVRMLSNQDSSSVLSQAASDDIVATPVSQKKIAGNNTRALPGHLLLRQQPEGAASTASKQHQQSSGSSAHPPKSNYPGPVRRESSLKQWACPVPSRYRQAVDEDDDDEADSGASVTKRIEPSPASSSTASSAVPTPESSFQNSGQSAHPILVKEPSIPMICLDDDPAEREFDPNRFSITSMESIDFGESSSEFLNKGPSNLRLGPAATTAAFAANGSAMTSASNSAPLMAQASKISSSNGADETEYDLKLNHKMLPLGKIRPTMGMNLATVDICGAKCHFQDLSGKFQNVWRSYYGDCDAVIFVFRVEGSDAAAARGSHDSARDADEDERNERIRRAERLNPKAQLALLTQVRGAIADDVPFLILGHLFDASIAGAHTDVLFSSSALLPHYHNPLQGVFFSRAVSGQGVRSALEWLVPLAKRQQHVRQQQQLHR
jgi:GTPase SAR1 family protein